MDRLEIEVEDRSENTDRIASELKIRLGLSVKVTRVALGSLPLCAEDLKTGLLTQLGDDVFESNETYWLLASRSAIGRRQWEALSEALLSDVD